MSDLKTNAIPHISTQEMPDLIRYAMAANEADPTAEIVVSFEGDPGTGKTSIPRSVAADEGWKYSMILAPHLDLVEGKGYPVYNAENEKVSFVPLDIWPTEPGPGILLIDEIAQAIPAVQASLSSLLYGGKMGNYVLPEGWLIITTGNLATNKAATHRMPSHIKNRLQRYVVQPSVDAFLEHGKRMGYHSTVLRFIASRSELLHQFSADDEICPTMRKWQKVSAVMQSGAPRTIRETMVKAEVGIPAAREFEEFIKANDDVPKYMEVVTDPENCRLVDETSYIQAVMTTLGRRGKPEHAQELVTYISRYGGEYQVVFVNQVKAANSSSLKDQQPVKDLAAKHSITL